MNYVYEGIGAVRRGLTGTNYCGPGGSGTTLGEVDEACAEHDAGYTAPYLYDYFESKAADELFLQRLDRARPVGFRQELTKAVAQRYFRLKLQFHSLRKGLMQGDGYIVDPQEGRVVALPSNRQPFPQRKRRARSAITSGREKVQTMMIAPPPRRKRVQVAFPYYRGKRIYAKKRFRRFTSRRLRYRRRRY